MMHKNFFIAVGLALFSQSSFALDKTDEEALQDTQKLLNNQAAMEAFAKDNKDATKALDQVKQLTGGNQAQMNEINNISSSVFADMVKANNGDSAAIQEQLQQALKDPSKFMKNLSPDQQARIRSLASEIEKKNQPASK